MLNLPYHNTKALFTVNNFVVLLVFLFPITAATVKNAGSIIMGLLLIIGLVTFRFKDLKLLDKEKYIFIGFLSVFLVGVLSMMNTENIEEGVHRLERLIAFPLSIFIYLFFIKNGLKLVQVFINGLMIAVVVMAWQAWYQIDILNLENASGAYHKIIFGDTAILFGVLLILHIYYKRESFVTSGVFILLSLSAFYASYASNTRGAWVLLPVIFVILALYILYKYRLSYKHIAFLFAVNIVFLMLLFENNYIYHNFTKEFLNIPKYLSDDELSEGNLYWRLVVWKIAINIWQENIFLGTGLGDFFLDAGKILESGGVAEDMKFQAKHAHSLYFDSLVTMGLVGLIVIMAAMFIVPVLMCIKLYTSKSSQKYYILSVFLVVVSFAVFGLSEGLLSRKYFIGLFLFLMVVYLSEMRLIVYKSTDGINLYPGRQYVGVSNSFSIRVSVFLLMILLCIGGVNKVVSIIKLNSLSPLDSFSNDIRQKKYGNSLFVFSDKIRIPDRYFKSFHGRYVVVDEKHMSCYYSQNVMYIYGFNKKSSMINSDSKSSRGLFVSNVYISEVEDGQSIIIQGVSNKPQCVYTDKDLTLKDFVKSNYYPIKNNTIHMYSNGYIQSRNYKLPEGEHLLQFEARSSCINAMCANIRFELFEADKDLQMFSKVADSVLKTERLWGVKEEIVNIEKDKMYFYRLGFINDLYVRETREDLNLYLRNLEIIH